MRRTVGRLLFLLVSLSLALLSAGLYAPEWLSRQPMYQLFAETNFGEFWIGNLWPLILMNGRGFLQVGTNIGILLVALYIWWRNGSVRRLCATVLYDNCFNVLVSWQALLQEAEKQISDGKGPDNGVVKSFVIKASPESRGWAHRLNTQLEVLRDFAIAYDHVLNQRGRMLAAFARMFALSAKELVEQLTAELDRAKDGERLELLVARYWSVSPFEPPPALLTKGSNSKSKAGADLGDQMVFLEPLMFRVVDANVDLAMRLDGINWFSSMFLAPGRNAPVGLRRMIKVLVGWHNQRKRKRLAPIAPFATYARVRPKQFRKMLDDMTEIQFQQLPKC